MDYKRLIGFPVKISRSDGRVHLANVTSVDIVKSSVMVEWQENNNCRGKEVEIMELFTLNDGLEALLQSKSAQEEASPLPPQQKKYEGRLRSSRIPAPSSSFAAASQAEDSVSRRTVAALAFQTPVPDLRPVLDSKPVRPVLDPIPEPSQSLAMYNQHGKQKKNRQPFALTAHATAENEEPKILPSQTTSQVRRKSSAYSEMNKSNKRQSTAANMKPPENQKRGKLVESSRPNFKFFQMIEDFRETLEIMPLSNCDPVEAQRICVCVRKRPMNKQELSRKEVDVVTVPGNGTLLVHEPKQKVDLTKFLENQTFHFDYSFDETATNELVYRFTAKPLVKSIFEGGMATCFAYGQTGSGKTHTMGGNFSGKSQNYAEGIYALAAQDVFTHLHQGRYASLNLCPYVTFFEIYNGKVFDLLNKKSKLRVLEDDKQQVQVVGLAEVEVAGPSDVIKLIGMGTACRTSGQTSANSNSSRSHAVLQIVLRRNDRTSTLHGKFSLVDLAGNERGSDVSGNERGAMVETAEINRSLLALKECIRSLGKNSDHIPFRMSMLTKVLRDSFIGDRSKTCMIAMVSPCMASCNYTLNTLRYADRVKELNGPSKATGAVKVQDPMDSSSEEDSHIPTVYDAISQVQELEEKFQEELQRASELADHMDSQSFDIEMEIPQLVDYAQKLLDTVLALRNAVNDERLARIPRPNGYY